MKITINISRSNNKQDINLENGSTVLDLLKKINLKPDTVIIMDKEKPVPVDEIIEDGQKLTIIQVSSGG